MGDISIVAPNKILYFSSRVPKATVNLSHNCATQGLGISRNSKCHVKCSLRKNFIVDMPELKEIIRNAFEKLPT